MKCGIKTLIQRENIFINKFLKIRFLIGMMRFVHGIW